MVQTKNLLARQQEQIHFFYDHLDRENVEKFVDEVENCRGSLVFSGIGKSEAIAKKIVSTLISTGTKASYLSPQNALHGDIALLQPEDFFIALSKSGDTEEILKLIPHIKARGIKTFAWVCQENSRLSQLCETTIYLPISSELCPYNLAPTTSAAVQLLFGDFLAVALMERNQLSKDSYALSHPSGNIGKKLTFRVDEFMLQGEDLPLIDLNEPLSNALIVLTNKGCGCLLIIDEQQKFQGIFTDGDLRRALQKGWQDILERPMSELMSKSNLTIEKETLLIDALSVMQANPNRWVKELPVLSDNKVIGLIRMHDIVQIGIRN